MLEIFTIILCATLSRLQGWDTAKRKTWGKWRKFFSNHLTSKYAVAVYFAMIAYALGISAGACFGMAIAWGLASAFGHGDYFDGTDAVNNEVSWIDKVTGWHLPHGFKKDYASMTLRVCYFIPFFAIGGWDGLGYAVVFIAALPPLYLGATNTGSYIRKILPNGHYAWILVEAVRGAIVGQYLIDLAGV